MLAVFEEDESEDDVGVMTAMDTVDTPDKEVTSRTQGGRHRR